MIEINQKLVGGISIDSTIQAVIIPSFNNGTSTANQSGNTVTISCSQPHNIPFSIHGGISNQNVGVYLKFASTIATGTFSNIIILDANKFLCTSNTSLNANNVSVSALGVSNYAIDSLGVTIEPNSLVPGNSIRTETFVLCPSVLGSRSMYNGVGTTSNTFIFSNVSMPYTWIESQVLSSLTYFLSNTDYISSTLGSLNQDNSLSKVVYPTSSINLTTGFKICPSVQFSSGTNDYQFIPMFKVEVV